MYRIIIMLCIIRIVCISVYEPNFYLSKARAHYYSFRQYGHCIPYAKSKRYKIFYMRKSKLSYYIYYFYYRTNTNIETNHYLCINHFISYTLDISLFITISNLVILQH